jgi:polyisoprenyl-phosphate glycosyltransferase
MNDAPEQGNNRELSDKLISVIVPVHNENTNILFVFAALQYVFSEISVRYEIIFINDGSTDNSSLMIEALSATHSEVRGIEFSRNFGKEAATSAGLHSAEGDAAICIDADLQHPPELIPHFIEKWLEGADVVIGVREKDAHESWIKKIGSYFYYKIINSISETPILPGATDFRLLDRKVIDSFKEFSERNRITRGLIDWLGFRRVTIPFTAGERTHGTASYTPDKLFTLAFQSFISHSLFPLRIAGYVGVIITTASVFLTTIMLIDRFLLDGSLNASSSAYISMLILFLIGIVLVCIGLLAFYIGHIHHETQGRPLYVVRKKV